MAKQTQAADITSDTKRRPRSEPATGQEPFAEMAGLSMPGSRTSWATGGNTLDAQLEGLRDQRFQGTQRRALATKIGRVQGNARLQRVVTALRQDELSAQYRSTSNGHPAKASDSAQHVGTPRSVHLRPDETATEPSPEVPGLPRRRVSQAQANLTTDPQAAVDAVVQGLVAQGQINLSYIEGRQMRYVGDRSRMPAGHYGHTSLTPGTGLPRPCRVSIGPDALRNVGVLYTTVMHEYQHVLQLRAGRVGEAQEAVTELEARFWEVRNLEQTGLWRDIRYMTVLPGQLRHWWGRLTPAQQRAMRAQYEAAQARIAELNRRRLEEQFRQQTGRSSAAARAVQRQNGDSMDAGVGRGPRDAGPVAGVPAPAPGPTPAEPELARPTFTTGRFLSFAPRFDAVYTPVGPVPSEGTFEIILKVHITYRDFSRALMRRQRRYRRHRFTREQLEDFTWSRSEKQSFASGFQSSVQNAWSGQHTLHLDDPTFSEYRASVQVTVQIVDDPGQAHTKITAQKVPSGAPRFRSFVRGDEAVLDIRDVSEPTSSTDASMHYVRQVGPFPFDSAELTPEIVSQLRTIESDLQPLQSPADRSRLLGDDWWVDFIGRASASGSRTYNERLALQRAQAVEQRMYADMGYPEVTRSRATSRGEEHASTDERFQRVDIQVWSYRRAFEEPPRTITQNVAAHEAGHMFGLGDEYVEEEPTGDVRPKFLADRPTHYGDVEALMGTEAANDLLVQNSGSIMSQGGAVRRGHYVYFLQRINQLTGKRWTVE